MYKVRMVGYIWQPGFSPCASEYSIADEVPFTREAIKGWLDKNAGDFQEVIDFSAMSNHGEPDIEWATEAAEIIWEDAMYPPEGE